MRRAIFTKMKLRFFTFFAFVSFAFCLVACNESPKVRTYEDAEREFVSSLTDADTFAVLALGQEFMQNLMAGGDLDAALDSLALVENNVLYRLSDESKAEIKARFVTRPVTDYGCVRYSFSTQAVNDLVYRYSTKGKLGTGPGMKLVLNPVKAEGKWFLTLKDAYQPSKDIAAEDQIHPMSPAPDPVRLNRKEFN